METDTAGQRGTLAQVYQRPSRAVFQGQQSLALFLGTMASTWEDVVDVLRLITVILLRRILVVWGLVCHDRSVWAHWRRHELKTADEAKIDLTLLLTFFDIDATAGGFVSALFNWASVDRFFSVASRKAFSTTLDVTFDMHSRRV